MYTQNNSIIFDLGDGFSQGFDAAEFEAQAEHVYMAADGVVAINADGTVNLVAHIDTGAQS